jgi:dTDP-4-dehydrorhamnose reductase
MRVLIIGGGGMLGHKVWQLAQARFETWATVRTVTPAMQAVGLADPERTCEGVDAFHFETVEAALDRVQPDAVINCVGVIKQLAGAKDPVQSITINALFPHLLARACSKRAARLIHISTDCVFDGSRGNRRQTETPDAPDLYGRSKALGEVTTPGSLTLRTSIIGRELSGASGLVEWFLSRRGQDADGYRNAVFSGLTTAELSAVIFRVLEEHPGLEGLYHVSAAPIDKLSLLELLNEAFAAQVRVTPREEPRIDRSLDGSAFREATGYVAPTWADMVQALASDPTPYERARVLTR